MTAEYPVLRYPGNITSSDQAQAGALLGWDEVGRPYEVLDAEWIPPKGHTPNPGCPACDGDGVVPDPSPDTDELMACPECMGHTNVYLQYAKPETIRAALETAGGPVRAEQAMSALESLVTARENLKRALQ